MNSDQVAVIILIFVSTVMVFYIMYQDLLITQFKGYIERMERGSMEAKEGSKPHNTGDQ